MIDMMDPGDPDIEFFKKQMKRVAGHEFGG